MKAQTQKKRMRLLVILACCFAAALITATAVTIASCSKDGSSENSSVSSRYDDEWTENY